MLLLEVLTKWEDYFSKLLNSNEIRVTPHGNESSETFLNTGDVPPPTELKVDKLIYRMENNKSKALYGNLCRI